MADKKQIEETLKDLPHSIELKEDLVCDAEKLTRDLYATKKSRKLCKKSWRLFTAISVCCMCVLIGVVTPIVYYLKPTDQPFIEPPIIKNYTDNELGDEELLNIEQFVSESEFGIKYFIDAQKSTVYRVLETEKPCIIAQQYIYFDQSNYDIVRFEVCLTNDTFNRHEAYQQLPEQRKIQDIEVQYSFTETKNGNIILAKFQFESHWYYLNISVINGEERLDYYIEQLIE